MSSEFPTSVRGFLDLVLVGPGFLTGSDVKDVEVEVFCSSFAEGVFLEIPELFRALGQLCSVQSMSYFFSKRPTPLDLPWISFFWSLENLSLCLVVVIFLTFQVAESLNKALCVLSSCRPCLRRRQLGRADPSLQVLRTT